MHAFVWPHGVKRSRRELLWGGVLVGCLVGFLFFSGATTGQGGALTADRGAAAVTGMAVAVAIAACVTLARHTVPPTGRAALLGVAVGAVYALTAALIKAASDVVAAHCLLGLLTGRQLYAVLALGAGGQLLTQLAFQAGPITSSLPAISTVDPLLSVLIGVLVYDEAVHRGPFGGFLLLVLLLLLVAAVIQLGRVETDEAPPSERDAHPEPSAGSDVLVLPAEPAPPRLVGSGQRADKDGWRDHE